MRLACDACGVQFVRDKNVAKALKAVEHFCSQACSRQAIRAGGSIDRRRSATCMARYGVPYLVNEPSRAAAAGRRAHGADSERRRWAAIRAGWHDSATALTRGLTLTRSRAERVFFAALAELVSPLAVETQVHVNGWFIDGRLAGTRVHLQFDGRYWHSSPRACERDARQDAWFKEQGLVLLRVDDVEWRTAPRETMVRILDAVHDALAA